MTTLNRPILPFCESATEKSQPKIYTLDHGVEICSQQFIGMSKMTEAEADAVISELDAHAGQLHQLAAQNTQQLTGKDAIR